MPRVTVEIPIKGGVVRVNQCDVDLVLSAHWRVTKGKWAYVIASGGHRTANTRKLHREIMGALPGQVVDHRDGDTLNNCRKNLRVCLSGENSRNRKPLEGQKFKGISQVKKTGRWRASITLNKIKVFIGTFANEEKAARAYDKKAKELHGRFARLNFPRKNASKETASLDFPAALATAVQQ